jgi:pimeloyl-ACP methyl ester carboxylesterase
VGASPQAPIRNVIANHDVRIEVLAQGEERGRVIVLLPSLGRGASDFDAVAERLAGAGYRVLRPQPRGIGQSRGPLAGIDLHDYASDVAAVIAHEGQGPAFVVGHAFGNRVARMLATDRPDLVRAVALVAANIGKAPSPLRVRQAIRTSADSSFPRRSASRRCNLPSLLRATIRAAGLRVGIPRFCRRNELPAIAPHGRRISRPAGCLSFTCSPTMIRWRMSRTLQPTRSNSRSA